MFKNKRISLYILLVLSIIVIAFFGIKKNYNYNQLIINKEEYNDLISSRTKANIECKVYFDDYYLISDNNHNLYYSLIEESNTKFNPSVRVEDDYEIKIYGEDINEEAIKDNKQYKIVIFNDEEYDEYNLICTTLPIMSIDSENISIDRTKQKAEFVLFDNRVDSKQRLNELEGTVHLRGGLSSSYPKQNYKLSLSYKSIGNNKRENDVSLLGLRKDDDYVLYSCYDEPSKVRNVFSSNLWKYSCAKNNSFGIDNGVEYKYIELIVNGDYKGLYALGYKVDSKTVGLNNNEIMYFKYTTQYNDVLNDFSEEHAEGYEIKENYNNELDWQPLLEYCKMVQTFGSEMKHFDNIEDYVDLDNQIDMFLFINLIQGVDHSFDDGSTHNIFLTAKSHKDWFKFLLTPWDNDRTWGYDGYTEMNDPNKSVTLQFSAAYILSSDEYYVNKIVERYSQLRQNEWSNENLLSMLEEYREDIFNSGAFSRDLQRWNDDEYELSYHYLGEEDYFDFEEYVMNRLSGMDNYIEIIFGYNK